MKTLKEHLCLNRTNFQINPKQSFDDANLFFGKSWNQDFIDNVLTGYAAGYVPRKYIFGNYGTGKTHLLYHLKYFFEQHESEYNVVPVVVQVEAESKTRFQSLHKRFLDAVGMEKVEKAYIDYGFGGDDREKRFKELFPDPNLYQVMQLLQAGPANKMLAWRWLTGERLSVAEQSQLGVTSILGETGDLVVVLVRIGELFKRTGKNLLFLIDESEALHRVTNLDAQGSWHDAFRRLADEFDNQSVGWMLTFYTTLHETAPTFMMEGDITSRLGGGNQVILEPLGQVEVQEFLEDLLEAFIDKDVARKLIDDDGLEGIVLEHYPFTEAGLDSFVSHAAAAPENSIPRTILRALTACGLESLRTGQRTWGAELVDQVVPPEFIAFDI